MVRRRQTEGGAIAVLAALLVMVLGGFLALTLDLGHKFNAKGQLEAAGDSAAIAAVKSLDGTATGLTTAHLMAAAIATKHKIDKSNVAINNNLGNGPTGDVVAGFWNTANKTFYTDNQTIALGDSTILLDPTTTPQYYNAIKVSAGADGAAGHNDPLDVFFGAFVGYSGTLKAKTSTIALGGGPCDENNNVLPMVVPSCAIADSNGSNLCGQTVTLSFNWGNGNDVAFADITLPDGSQHAGEDEIQQQITSALNDTAPLTSAFQQYAMTNGLGGGAPRSGDPNFGAGTLNMLPVCGGAPASCRLFVIPVVNVGTDCATRMASRPTPVGFVQVSIMGRTWNDATNVHTISLYLNCTNPSNHRPGCVSFGFPSQFRPWLVK